MIHALHGNVGSPDDWSGIDLPGLVTVDLWDWQEKHPRISLENFGQRFAGSCPDAPESSVLLGYSLGGRLALQALAASPVQWRAVVLVSVHPGLETERERSSRLATDRDWADRARHLDWPVFLEAWNAQPVLVDQAIGKSQVDLGARREAIAHAFESWSLGHQAAMDQVLSDCRTPVLVIHGERDAKFASLASRLVDGLPGAEGRAIPGAGHRLLTEAPGDLEATIRSWLSDRGLLEIS